MGRFIDGPSGGITSETNAPGITTFTKGGTTIVDYGTTGCYVFTPPVGVTQVTFEVWGGGGGSASINCCLCGLGAASAAGGGYASYTASVTSNDVYNICVGAGGWSVNGYACCCCGCNAGFTCVTGGYFLTVGCPLAATGGGGSPSALNCACGGSVAACSIPGYGCGPIGTIAMCGSMGNLQSASGTYSYGYQTYGFAGSAPKTSGVSWTGYDHCNSNRCGCPGAFPGGASESPAMVGSNCSCCNCVGPGATGLVRITY